MFKRPIVLLLKLTKDWEFDGEMCLLVHNG
jgi:hypothetical protein